MHVKLMETGETRTLPAPAGLAPPAAWFPAVWLPGGTELLAAAGQAGQKSTWIVSILGGTPRELHDDGWVNSVSPDGSLVAFTTGVGAPVGTREIWLMGARGEDPHKLVVAEQDEGFAGVVWSPNGQRIAYLRLHQEPNKFQCTIEDRDLKGGRPTLILSDPKLFASGKGPRLKSGIRDNIACAGSRQEVERYTLHFGDCLSWMEKRGENSIHAIVTDPPYGLREYTPQEKEKLRNGRGGVWRIPPSFDGCKRRPLPRFTAWGWL